MVLVLILVGVGAFFIYPAVAPVFLASIYLNGFILAVFVVGVLACFWQVLQLVSSVSWIEGFALNRPGHEFVQSPRLLASLAALLKDQRARRGLTAGSSRSILDSVATRLDEARDITRYIINLLIFLGLLGTFYGLATTVPAVVETIRSLAPTEGEAGVSVFNRLITGLEAQLGGMGTAFASSLLGLAGSLIVGMLELFAGHGQNRFYRELEEWISSITRIGLVTGDSDGGPISEANLIVTAVEQAALQVDELREIVARSEERRAATENKLDGLADTVGRLADTLASQPMGGGGPATLDPAAFDRIVEGQNRMIQVMEARDEETGAFDAETRMRLRNIDVQILRILEEIAAGRQDSVAELRRELNAIADVLARR